MVKVQASFLGCQVSGVGCRGEGFKFQVSAPSIRLLPDTRHPFPLLVLQV